MSFAPAIPYSDREAWVWFKDNRAAIETAAEGSISDQSQANLDYFAAEIGKVETPAGLTNNPVLLRVALEAFGLEEDLPSPSFLEAALTRGTEDPDALARDLGDARYAEMARAFGFGPYTEPKTKEDGFAQTITDRWRIQRLEEGMGAAEPAMRRALVFDRVMKGLSDDKLQPGVGWEQALSHHSVRRVIGDTLSLPADFERLSLGRQAEIVRGEMLRRNGTETFKDFATEAGRDVWIKAHFDASRRGAFASFGPATVAAGAGKAGFDRLTGSLDQTLDRFSGRAARHADMRHAARAFETLAPDADGSLAGALVADERLRDLALEAFGLENHQPTDEWLTAVLESDPADPNSAAASLDDPRWAEMARFFGFGSGGGAALRRFGFADEFANRLGLARMEAAVGAQDEDMRRALVLDRTLSTLASEPLSNDAAWRALLGHGAARAAVATALDLEDASATLGVGGMAEAARDAARRLIGTDDLSALSDGYQRDQLFTRFFREAARDETPRGGLGQPTIPLPGVAGWRYLQSTLDSQRESFANSFAIRREIEHFEARIGEIDSAEELMADRRLRRVTLTAFGLGEETDKGAFMERVLAEGSERQGALATQLSDPRFREFARAFGFGDGRGAQTRTEGFAGRITARYVEHAFEAAVGEVDESMRLALNFERQSVEIIASGASDRASWFRALGEPPMRRVLESAFNLPAEFSQADLDYQLEQMRERSRRTLGSADFAGFLDTDRRESLIGRFFVGETITNATAQSFNTALSLLQGSGGAGGLNQLL